MSNSFKFLSVWSLFCICLLCHVQAETVRKKSVIDLGTKVTAAVEMENSSCAEKYTACMDAGCMIDNDSGGRCQCSNRVRALNEELEKLKNEDYDIKMLARSSQEAFELGKYADRLIPDDSDEDDVDFDTLSVSGAIGDKLRAKMHEICTEKLPDCESQLKLITNLYSQKIKADCAAFENALTAKSKENEAHLQETKKLARDAALEQYKSANKYDLGQCITEFTSCMQTEAECGEDWTGCIVGLGLDKMFGIDNGRVAIQRGNSKVSIAKSTMTILENKKIICEHVINQCVDVKDQVWTSFLKNVAPDIKDAELKSEADARMSCLTNVSECFKRACKDNIDSNNPNSYDMCLTHPESMKNFCKVELEPCLTATGGDFANPEKSTLWTALVARLASMRVDSCTTELKECLQHEDRCGKDYSQCVNISTQDIMSYCPYEKLVGCQQVYGKEKILSNDESIYNDIVRIVEGIILDIDNKNKQYQYKKQQSQPKIEKLRDMPL